MRSILKGLLKRAVCLKVFLDKITVAEEESTGPSQRSPDHAVTTMPQSLARICLHLVFSTKGRQPMLSDRALRGEMHSFLGGLCKTLECPVVAVGGVEDHIQVACHLGRVITVANLIKELKRESSAWIKSRSRFHSHFEWQAGYGAFSVSPSHLPALIEYIATQETHHQQESFQDELRRILRIYDIAWDERYLWD